MKLPAEMGHWTPPIPGQLLTPETCCDPDDPCECPWEWIPPKRYQVRYSQRFVSQTLDLMWPKDNEEQ